MDDYEEIWRLMEKYDFEIAGDSLNCVICSICGKLLKEAYYSICGCQFCKNCIINYLNNQKKQCPGHKERCKKVILEIERTVSKDFRTCYDISKTKVKCPNNKCMFKNELETTAEHLRCCKMKPTLCPYHTFGCEDSETTEESINDHLHLEILKHSQLLIEAVNNLNNDLEGVKQNNEIKQLKEELERNQNMIEEQKLEINQFKERGGNNEEIVNFNKVIDGLRKEFKEVTEKNLKELNVQRKMIDEFRNEKEKSRQTMDGLKEEINVLRKDVKTSQQRQDIKERNIQENNDNVAKDMADMKARLEEVKREVRIVKEIAEKSEGEKLKKDVEKQSLEVNNIKNQILKCSEEINKSSIIKSEDILKVVYDFVWTIKDFSKKKGEQFSDHFTTNNYKLCLRMWIGSDRLWLFVCVKRGEIDDKASWPLRHSVILSILNQESLTPYLSERYSLETYKESIMVFNKPNNDQDGRIGGLEILLSDIKTVRGLLIKDSLMVCCSLIPPSF